jgi:Cadherin-like domain
MSVTSPSQKGGVVAINENGTVTFFPRTDITGSDRFTYTISDGEGNSDKARVSVIIIKAPVDGTADKQRSTRIFKGKKLGMKLKYSRKMRWTIFTLIS